MIQRIKSLIARWFKKEPNVWAINRGEPLKEAMEENVIYVYLESPGKYAAKGLASNGECYAIGADPTRFKIQIAIESVRNSLWDVQRGGNGYGTSGAPIPPEIDYRIVYL